MKICGVTAEYNPFHEGHAYHIAKAKEITGADALVVVMSGHFVQRGEPAVFDPYARAEAALKGGADAVFMMPPEASTSSAEGFAGYGVGLLDRLGCDCISCGIEPGSSVEKITETGEMLAEETQEFSEQMKLLMKTGISYPEAMARALNTEQVGPNTLLAIEYVKAMKRIGSRMDFIPLTRVGAAYDDNQLHDDGFPSATALRRALLKDEKSRYVYPEKKHTENRPLCPLGPDDFLPEIINSIQRSSDPEQYLDVDEAIAARLKKTEFHYHSFEEMVRDIKTKEYTYTRIARALIHIYLEIHEHTKEITNAQLIGFRTAGVLTEIKNRSGVEIISKAADYKDDLKSSARAAALYNQVYWKKYGEELPNFYRQKIVRLN